MTGAKWIGSRTRVDVGEAEGGGMGGGAAWGEGLNVGECFVGGVMWRDVAG